MEHRGGESGEMIVKGPLWLGGVSVVLALGSFGGMILADAAQSEAGMLTSLAIVAVAGVCGVVGAVWALRTRPMLAGLGVAGVALSAIPIIIVVDGAMKMTRAAVERTREAETPREWIDASSQTAETPRARIEIESARVGVAEYPNPFLPSSIMRTESPVLQVRVIVENTSAESKIDFATWRLDSAFDRRMSLRDRQGNTYRMVGDDDTRVDDAVNFASLYPGDRVVDTLLFERPVSAQSDLMLTLDARWEDDRSSVHFLIPAKMIEYAP